MRSRNFESLQSSVDLVNPEEAMDLNRIVGLPEKATPC